MCERHGSTTKKVPDHKYYEERGREMFAALNFVTNQSKYTIKNNFCCFSLFGIKW